MHKLAFPAGKVIGLGAFGINVSTVVTALLLYGGQPVLFAFVGAILLIALGAAVGLGIGLAKKRW